MNAAGSRTRKAGPASLHVVGIEPTTQASSCAPSPALVSNLFACRGGRIPGVTCASEFATPFGFQVETNISVAEESVGARAWRCWSPFSSVPHAPSFALLRLGRTPYVINKAGTRDMENT